MNDPKARRLTWVAVYVLGYTHCSVAFPDALDNDQRFSWLYWKSDLQSYIYCAKERFMNVMLARHEWKLIS